MNQTFRRPGPMRGYALMTALIFLVLLTLVALAAIKGSGLEAKMSSNNTMRTQAFESSELSRTLVEQLIDANTFNRGWPNSIGGDLPNNQFDTSLLALLATTSGCTDGFCISRDKVATTKPVQWYNGNSESWFSANSSGCLATGCVFKPNSLDTDATYRRNVATAGGSVTIPLAAEVAVFKLYNTPAVGAGLAMDAGYLQRGRSSANGGSLIYYYVSSRGHESAATTPEASAQTAALFREVPRN